MSLEEQFQTVDGVGEVKASELAEIANEHRQDADLDAFREGMDYYENGDYEYAGKFFRRVLE